MEDYHFDNRMMENTVHLMSWIHFPSNISHFVNTSEKVIWKAEHSYLGKVNEKPNMI